MKQEERRIIKQQKQEKIEAIKEQEIEIFDEVYNAKHGIKRSENVYSIQSKEQSDEDIDFLMKPEAANANEIVFVRAAASENDLENDKKRKIKKRKRGKSSK